MAFRAVKIPPKVSFGLSGRSSGVPLDGTFQQTSVGPEKSLTFDFKEFDCKESIQKTVLWWSSLATRGLDEKAELVGSQLAGER